jgi:hypothetical protein
MTAKRKNPIFSHLSLSRGREFIILFQCLFHLPCQEMVDHTPSRERGLFLAFFEIIFGARDLLAGLSPNFFRIFLC